MKKPSFLILSLLLTPGAALAAGGDRLKSFLEDTKAVRAHFTQTVRSKNAKGVQEASGTMQFSRPGKFRWTYDKPYEQLLVGDGQKLWIYDADLNQVTVKKLDQAIGSSPAALLAGSNEIEQAFAVRDAGEQGGLEWLEATPKSRESTFESVRMGFRGDTLAVMELRDNFGQTTLIRFSNVERNPKLAASLFKFTPPKGADVVGD